VASRKELVNTLIQAKKNYRAAVRWYREVLAYRNTVRGDEWKNEGSWIADDAEVAYNEVVKDIKIFRQRISKIRRLLKENEDGIKSRRLIS